MEYKLDHFRQSNGKVFTTSDGFKYLRYKVMGNETYLRCVLTKKGCKGTSILNNESNLVTPKSPHNHVFEEYNSEVHELKETQEFDLKIAGISPKEIWQVGK